MTELQGETLIISAPMTMANGNALLQAGLSAFEKGCTRVDLGAVTEVDSAALSLMCAWMRHTGAQNRSLQFVHVPGNLRSLADLYDLTDLLPLA